MRCSADRGLWALLCPEREHLAPFRPRQEGGLTRQHVPRCYGNTRCLFSSSLGTLIGMLPLASVLTLTPNQIPQRRHASKHLLYTAINIVGEIGDQSEMGERVKILL